MKSGCIIGRINEISLIAGRFIEKRIREERLPVLRNHIPLFYILPEDGSAMIFNEIASAWDISKSSLSDIINKYESQELINKCICSEDKRSVYISLRPDAVYIRKKLFEIEEELKNIMLKDFENQDREGFEKNINKALKNINKIL